MTEPEPMPVAAPVAAAEDEPGMTNNGYAAVRFNAVKHGILSRCTVLPHEDDSEYAALLAALVVEHRPAGPTQEHLVEELAGIMWRKRRLRLAEGAEINEGLRSVAKDYSAALISKAVPLEFGMSGSGTDVRDLLSMSPSDVDQWRQEVQDDLQATEKAAAILKRGEPRAYDKALGALKADSCAWWQEHVQESQCPETAEALMSFVQDSLLPACRAIEKEARHYEAIKAQVLGEGLQVYRLEKLCRYETHLDRKFERTLAMLLKLKEICGGR